MIFTEISFEELNNHQKTNNDRYFFSQTALYKKLADHNGLKSKILAVKENNEILAYSIFLYFPYKKLFFKATTQYGPIMDFNNEELSKFYFEEVKKYFAKDMRVLAVRVNPFINEKIFNDVEEIGENSIAGNVHEKLTAIGFKSMNEDLFSNPTLSSRCVFSKDLTDLTEDKIMNNLTPKAKSSINKTISDKVKIRILDLFCNNDENTFAKLLKSTNDRITTSLRDVNYFKTLKNILGDNIIINLAYIDKVEYLEDKKNTLIKWQKEKTELEEQIKNNPDINYKKTTNKINEIEKNIVSIQKKINKIETYEISNEVPLSIFILLQSGQDLIYFQGLTDKELNMFEGPYALSYDAIKFAINNNFKFFNLYGTSSDFSKNSTDHSILQFKRTLKGNVEWFMDNYELRNNIGKFLKI